MCREGAGVCLCGLHVQSACGEGHQSCQWAGDVLFLMSFMMCHILTRHRLLTERFDCQYISLLHVGWNRPSAPHSSAEASGMSSVQPPLMSMWALAKNQPRVSLSFWVDRSWAAGP